MQKVNFQSSSEQATVADQQNIPSSHQKADSMRSSKTGNPMPKSKKPNPSTLIVLSIAMVFAGIASGFGLHKTIGASSPTATQRSPEVSETGEANIKAGEVYGANNGEIFTDEVEGVLVAGGIKGEGTHHLMRVGGPSQNVYLTSSVLDLDLFEGHHVKVWGETFSAQQAGWLMDVGKVEVVELNAEKPFEETEK